MAIKDFMQKVQGFMGKVTAPRESAQKPPMSTMPNGSISGYQPRVGRRPAAAAAAPETHPAASFAGMAPAGVNPNGIPQFMPPLQPVQPQGVPVQAPQQPYGNQAGSQPMPPAGQTMGAQAPYQPRHQSPQPPMQQTGYVPPVAPQQTGFMPPVQPQQPAAPAPQGAPESNVRYFPGTVTDEAGASYAMVMRIAQVTGIASCYALLEFMQYDEAIIVNLDQITDVLEANRCIDMLFGAAYAMHHTFERIAARSVYLIAPQRMHVLPCENMMHMSRQDADRRWPGLSRMGGAQRGDGRQEDFAPAFGQRAAAPQAPGYASYGGFGRTR